MDYQTLDPDTQKAPDNKEGLYFGVEVGPDSEDAGKPLCGPQPVARRGAHLTINSSCQARPWLHLRAGLAAWIRGGHSYGRRNRPRSQCCASCLACCSPMHTVQPIFALTCPRHVPAQHKLHRSWATCRA